MDTLPIDIEDKEDPVLKKQDSYVWEPQTVVFEEFTFEQPAVIQNEEVLVVKKERKVKPKAISGFKAVNPAISRNGSSKLIKKLKNKHVNAFEPMVTKFLPPNE